MQLPPLLLCASSSSNQDLTIEFKAYGLAATNLGIRASQAFSAAKQACLPAIVLTAYARDLN